MKTIHSYIRTIQDDYDHYEFKSSVLAKDRIIIYLKRKNIFGCKIKKTFKYNNSVYLEKDIEFLNDFEKKLWQRK